MKLFDLEQHYYKHTINWSFASGGRGYPLNSNHGEARLLRPEPLSGSAEGSEIELALSAEWLRSAPGERGGN